MTKVAYSLLLAATAAACAHRAPPGDDARPAPDSTLARSVHVALGVPTDADPADEILIDRTHWVASYNPKRLVPNWVSWRLFGDDLGSEDRQNDFRADDGLPPEVYAVKATDYRGSGYDRGHMCPSADRTATVEANSSTFLMTNMQPQMHALNAGPWKGLEAYAQGLARDGKQVQVVAGGIFADPIEKIGPGVAVPVSNFKIVAVLDPGQTADAVTTTTPVYAVVMPNTTGAGGTKWTQYLVSVDEVERQSGYDFLAAVVDDVEAVVEARVAAPGR